MRESLDIISNYRQPAAARKEQEPRFLGWWDEQAFDDIDGTNRCVHFVSRKTYARDDIETVYDHAWALHHDGNLYKQSLLGPHTDFHHKILQKVHQDLFVIQCVERYPGMVGMFHYVAIVFRKKTPTGYLVGLRSVPYQDLQRVMDCPDMYTGQNFYWCTWQMTKEDDDGKCSEYTTTLNGYLGANHPGYAQRWVLEVVLTLIRAETQYMGANMVLKN